MQLNAKLVQFLEWPLEAVSKLESVSVDADVKTSDFTEGHMQTLVRKCWISIANFSLHV